MSSWIDIAGWTLVHFLWEGTLIALLAWLALWRLYARSPQSRYAVACAALAAMLAAPPITAAVLMDDTPARPGSPPQAPAPAATAASADTSSGPVSVVTVRRVVVADDATAASAEWLPVVVVVWMSGVALLCLRLAGGWWRVRRLQQASRAAAPSPWSDAAGRIAETLGLARAVRVIDSALVDTPTVIGLVRPVILLPMAAVAGLSPSQVEAILAHELAHIRRHDFLVNVLQTVAETILFYHPGVWWISARIRAEREHCCDVVALSVCGDPVGYAEALVELESWRTADVPLSMAATGGRLLTRVRRLLGAPPDGAPRPAGVIVVAAAALVIGVAGASHYLLAAQPNTVVSRRVLSADDPAAWSMIFRQSDSTMRFVGFRGRDLIRFAYQVPRARVVGGPDWLDEQILDIVTTLDRAPQADQMPGLVRQTLEQRLHLKMHVEQRNFPVLALVMAREDRALGPRLRTASRPCFDVEKWIEAGQPQGQAPSGSNRIPACGGETDSPWGWTQYASITMAQFAEELRDYVRGYVFAPRTPAPARLGPTLVAVRPPDIVDRTGLRGRYDVEFTAFYPTAALMTRFPLLKNVFEPLGFTSVPRALEDQLGLALVESEAPYDVIVIDQAERP